MNNEINKTELGLYANFFKGNGIPKSALTYNGKYNCIHYGQLFTYYSEAITKIKSKTNYHGFLGEVNDVLMPTSDVTPNGLAKASCLHINNVIIGGDILVIRPKEELDGNFLSFSIRNAEKQILSLVTGSTVFHLYAKDMKKFQFYMPKDKKEQKKIAEILLNANKTINSLETLINKKKLILKGAMQNLLSGKIRLEGFSNQWDKKQIKELFNLSAGGDLNKTEFSLTKTKDHFYPIYANSILNSGIYGYSSHSNRKKDTLTVTARGTLGKAFLRNEDYVAIGRLLVLEKKILLNNKFYEYYINEKIKIKTEQTSIPQLTAPNFGEYYVYFPNINEQDKISSILFAMEKEINKLEKKLTKLKLIKKGMEEQLLTGKIRLPLN